ncbi:MAG TPA: DUF6597 domain-containing transcriptional factor [Kofleriaceae bacterium]|nr:DUF6597 domain-containing transcriptional factor [Kofleriaceae bacterium]
MHDELPLPGDDDAPPVRYRETAPPPALARSVCCTWSLVVGDGARDHLLRVLPDGCADLVWVDGAPPFAAGPATRTDEALLAPGTVVVGVRFRPGWAPYGLGAEASDLLDRDVRLTDLWGRGAAPLIDSLDRPATARARLDALERALLAHRGAPGTGTVDPLGPVATAWLARHPGGRIEALAREIGVSPRQLHRRFVAAVGYGPKTFQRIARFQRLLALARPPARARLGQLALEAGYADQAHMTREVGELAGRTPAAVVGRVGSALEVADLFPSAPDPLRGTTPLRR